MPKKGFGVVDSSIAGLGTETGIDLDRLAATGTWIIQAIGRTNRSQVGVALTAK